MKTYFFIICSTSEFFPIHWRVENLGFLKSLWFHIFRSSRPEVFLVKGVLQICSKFTGEHSCQGVISIKLQSNFIEITLWHGCSPVNLQHIFRKPFSKSPSGWLLLDFVKLWGESFRHSMFVAERCQNFWLNCQFSRKINVHIYVTIFCQFKWRKK